MKKIRIFAALLCMVFAISALSSVAFAAEDGSGTAVNHSDAIEELRQIGLTDNIGFTLGDNKPITRAEFVAIVMNVDCGNAERGAAVGRVFDDVGTDLPYAWAISAAVGRGFISGNGDGLFEPNEPMSYDGAVKILVSALGYGLRAEAKGGFPSGYLRQAAILDIELDTVANPLSLTGGEAAAMVLAAVNTEIMAPSGFGNSVTYEVKSDETWLKTTRDTVRYEGVMQANAHTSLYGAGGLGEGKAEIDGVKYKTECDIDGYLGYNLYYYVRGDDTIVYACPVSNDVTVIYADDVSDTDGRNIVYYENNKRKTVALPKGAAVIYNNIAYPDYEMKDFVIKSGRIEFIEINNTIETAKIFDMRPVYVAAADTAGEVIYDAIGQSSIDYGNFKSFDIYDENGKATDMKKIDAGDVLNMYISAKGDYASAYKSTGKAEGMITAVSDEDGISLIGVDGVEYEISAAGSIDAASLVTGDRIKIYLDCDGRAVYSENGARDAAKYAYLISISATGGMDEKFTFKLYDSDDEVKKIDAADKLKINGNEIKTVADLPSGLEDGGAVLYELNADGQISRLYTPDASGSPLVTVAATETRKFYPRETGYVFAPENSDAVSSAFCIDKNTLMLCIPDSPSSAADKRFSIASPIGFTLFEERNVSAYTKNPDSNVAEFVLETASANKTVNSQNEAFIITSVMRAVNDDGDEVYSITVSGKNVKNKTYKTIDQSIGAQYEPGDVVILNRNSQDEITEMQMIVDLNADDGNGGTAHKVITSGTGITKNFRWYSNIALFEGYPYSVKNKIVRFALKDTDPTTIGAAGDTFYFDSKNMSVFEVDMNAAGRGKVVTERAIGSFAGYKENGLTEECILYVRQGTPMMMIIYK